MKEYGIEIQCNLSDTVAAEGPKEAARKAVQLLKLSCIPVEFEFVRVNHAGVTWSFREEHLKG